MNPIQLLTVKRLPLFIFIFFVSLYILTAGGHFYHQDDYHKFLTTDSLIHGKGPFNSQFYVYGPGVDGKKAALFPPGTSLWMMPLYLLGNLCLQGVLSMKPAVSINTEVFFAPFFVTFLNALFTAAACVYFFKFARQMKFFPPIAAGGTILLGMTTLLWPYSKFSYSESQAAFFLMAAFYYLFQFRHENEKHYVTYGALFFGASILTKYETVFLFPAYLGYLIGSLKNRHSQDKKQALVLFLGILTFFAGMILAWNYWCFGNPFFWGRYGMYIWKNPLVLAALPALLIFGIPWIFADGRQISKKLRTQKFKKYAVASAVFLIGAYFVLVPAAAKNVLILFFSSGKSIFIFNPLLFTVILAFGKFSKEFKAESYFIAAIFLLYLFLLPYDYLPTAWQWGPRYYVSLIPLLFLPFLVFLRDAAKYAQEKFLVGILILFSFAVQIIAISVNYNNTFNYTAQSVALETQVALRDSATERQYVFPKLLHSLRHAPVWMQGKLLTAILTQRLPPAPEEKLAFKGGVRTPAEWKIDFWWVHLFSANLAVGIVKGVLLLLMFSLLFSVFSIFMILRKS
ncbi:MAG: glycosyltransferase family 39 protein [Candidatus Omnitrophica bacterium]|nr:glycosyltransferase family 39 protein [Candidatus Omnitrophota bacterium]